jgi:hypothetical protein
MWGTTAPNRHFLTKSIMSWAGTLKGIRSLLI